MIKRFTSLVLTVTVLCVCMTVPVGASEVGDMQQFINVLDFATPNNSGVFYVSTNSSGIASARFDLPYGTILRYFDMYVQSGSAIRHATVNVGNTSSDLTVIPVSGTTYYRIYGITSGYGSTFSIDFDTGVSSHRIQIHSLRVSSQALSIWQSPSTLTLEGWEKKSVTQATGTSAVMLSVQCGSTANSAPIGVGDYLIGVHNEEWRKYDSMNFTMIVAATTLNAITCTIGNQRIPFEMNVLEGNIPSNDAFWTEGSHGENRVFYDVNVSVDLTGVNRTLTGDLILTCAGTGATVSVALYDSRGYTVADLPEAETTWLQRIWLGIRDMVAALRGDEDSADNFNDKLDEEIGKLEEDKDVIDSMTTPNLEDVVGDFDMNSDAGDGIGFVGSIFASLWASPLSLVFLYSGIFALIGYLLYGRRH